MAASNTDLFKKAKRKFSTTVGAGGFAQGATTLPLTTTTGLDTDTAITLMLDPGGATEEVITGVVSGSDVINCVRGKEGTTDQDHSAGDAVSMYFTETHWDDAMTGILQDHDQSGQHKNLTDANGNEWIKQTATSSAVNEITVANAATGNGPVISATGGDTNIDLVLTPKGTGKVLLDSFYGWQRGTGTWTYASSTTFTVPAADAALMGPGTKLWFTQTTSKYFYVSSVSGTTVTINANGDYTLANATITAPYFSNAATPINFPQWFSFTPSWTNLTPGSGTNVGYYAKIGRTILMRVRFVYGSGSSVGSNPILTLPVTSSSNISTNTSNIGSGMALDSGTANYPLVLKQVSTTTVVVECMSANTTYVQDVTISSTVPFTWTTNDEIVINFFYESAA